MQGESAIETQCDELVCEARNGSDREQNERFWIVALVALVIINVWVALITSSLWLDETGTWWIVKDGWREVAHRAISWSGVSPAYFFTAWASSRLLGMSEFSLRLPSVVAMLAAVYYLYRIAAYIYDRSSAAIVALAFLCMASYYGIEAKAYALALLGLTASTWWLLRWVEMPRFAWAALYILFATLTLYAHCIVALGLAPAAVYAILVVAQRSRKRLAWLGCCYTAIGALSLPLLPEMRTFYATRSVHTFASLPSLGDTINSFFPGSLAGVVIVGLWIYRVYKGDGRLEGRCADRFALLVGLWSVWAPAVLFLLLVFTDMRLFVPRYCSSSLPGQALLLGGLISSMRSNSARKIALVALGLTAVVTQGRMTNPTHGDEDWRSAMRTVREEAGTRWAVVLVGGFVEASSFKALDDPKLKDILFAPELMYGEPARSIRVPNDIAQSDLGKLEAIANRLKQEEKFLIVAESPLYYHWFRGALGARCQAEQVAPGFASLVVTRFVCAVGAKGQGSL